MHFLLFTHHPVTILHLLHAHSTYLGVLTVVYQLLFEPQYPLFHPFQNVTTKEKSMLFLVCQCQNMLRGYAKRSLVLFSLYFIIDKLKNFPTPTNWDNNVMLYPRLHSLLTICLSSQTWSFHLRQSLSTPVGPYTHQYSYPLRAPVLGLVQSSTAQALCCRMTQPPPIL